MAEVGGSGGEKMETTVLEQFFKKNFKAKKKKNPGIKQIEKSHTKFFKTFQSLKLMHYENTEDWRGELVSLDKLRIFISFCFVFMF